MTGKAVHKLDYDKTLQEHHLGWIGYEEEK